MNTKTFDSGGFASIYDFSAYLKEKKHPVFNPSTFLVERLLGLLSSSTPVSPSFVLESINSLCSETTTVITKTGLKLLGSAPNH